MAGRNDLEKEKNVSNALLVAISIGAIGSVGRVVNKMLKNGENAKAISVIAATITALAATPLGKVIHFKEIKGLTELMKLLK